MRARESVVDPDVAELRKLSDECRIVLFLAGMKAGVLETENLAVLHCGDGHLCNGADAVGRKLDVTQQDIAERIGNRLQRLFRVRSLGPAEMRKDHNPAAGFRQLDDGLGDALQTRGVGHASVVHRHVKVDAQQHALSLHVDIIEGAKSGHQDSLRLTGCGESR